MTSLCFVFLVFAGGFVVSHAQNITIQGNNESLISGLEQDITCIFTGQGNVSLIEWLAVVGDLEFTATKDTSGARVLLLTLTPRLSSDGSQFKCRVTTSSGETYEETITISVKNLEHTLIITASASNPVAAGSSLTLQCVATSDREPRLKWIDPDGNTIRSGNGATVSAITTSGVTSTISLTFNNLRTSHAKSYTCRCDIDVPSSTASTSYLVTVQISAPTVTTVRDPDSSTQLYTTDSLVLTCLVELDAAVDTPIAVTTQWSVTPSPPRVTVVPASGVAPYNSSIRFSSLKSSDTGTYVCTVQVTSDGSSNVIASLPTSHSIDISAGLNVDIVIEYDSPYDYEHTTPPYYRPCTGVSLACEVYGASGAVSYTWTSSNSDSFLNGETENNVSVARLTSNDNGLHKCCVSDANDNEGCAFTRMIIKGTGIYIEDSEYISGHGVPDNSFIVAKSTSCTNCRLDIHCCSEVSTGTVYIEFPDGVRKESSDDYNNIVVEQLSDTAGVRVYNYKTYLPQLYGVYTCHAPSLQGEIKATSVAVYGNDLPDAPRVYYSEYSDLSKETDSDHFLNLTCSTSDSPPTKVIWYREGQTIDIDGTDYDSEKVVTDRLNAYYDNTLYVKNVLFAAGRHEYQCRVENTQGSDIHSITTNVPVYDTDEITSSGSNSEGGQFVLTCRVGLRGKLNQLLPFVQLQWLGPSGVDLTTNNDVHIGLQKYSSNETSLALTFDPLSIDHSGLYRCILSISKPSLAPSFKRELRYECKVITQSLFQLRFALVVPCARWYDYQGYSIHLEHGIVTEIVDAINERCNCGFTKEYIDLGEFSCQSTNTAVYRAQITGTTYTSTQLLAYLQDWVTRDGTFLFTHSGIGIRLRLDPYCPIPIGSFSEPECGISVDEATTQLFGPRSVVSTD